MTKKISDLDKAFLRLQFEFRKREEERRDRRKRAAAKRRRVVLAAGILLFLAVPAHSQSAKWTKEDCQRIEKQGAWPGMSPEMAAASEWLQTRSPDNPGGKRLWNENCAQQSSAAKKVASAKPAAPIAAGAAAVPAKKTDVASSSSVLWSIVLLFAGGCFYLLPGIVGQNRHHHQRTAIWVLNIFLGWTVLGWIAALVWASTAITAQQHV